jgi:soluble lytic murein transglycosylase-like protein
MQIFRFSYLASAALVLALQPSAVSAHVHPHQLGFYHHHHSAYLAEAQGIGRAAVPRQSYFQASQQALFSPPLDDPSFGAARVPQSLVDRVILRESGGNPRAVSHGNYGLMQIRLSTARAMGYTGSAAGLLDPQTNMTYAVRYLAGAYRAAGGNEARAIALYSRGYYYEAKRQGFSPYEPGTAPFASLAQ